MTPSDPIEVPKQWLEEAVALMDWAAGKLYTQAGGRGGVGDRAQQMRVNASHLASCLPPEVGEAEEGDEADGWPDGYAWERSGAYYSVTAPDGSPVESDAPSGKWNGEDAAQEAAWAHFRAG